MIAFWATWCKPCIEKIPELKALYNRSDRDEFEIIGVSLDKTVDKLKNYLLENEIRWPQIFEGGSQQRKGEVTRLYNGVALPTYYVVDESGVIIYNYFSGKDDLEIDKFLEDVLGAVQD